MATEGHPPDADICPYLGLETFQEKDAEFFFGRAALTQWLGERLRERRCLAVIGPSGSGKSSVVRAGLLPALRQEVLPAIEAVSARQTEDGILPIPAAEEALRAALALVKSKTLSGGNEGEVSAVGFSPDGRWLATGSRGHLVQLWRIRVHELVQLAYQIANRNLTQDEWQRLLGNTPYHKTCVDLPVHPSVYKPLLEVTEELIKQGQIKSGLETLAKVQRLEPAAEISADTWYGLCWFGSLWNAATEVMPTCKKVVELAPAHGIARQGRGLARALTGNLAGAIEDVTMYLEWAPENYQSEEEISLRRQWTEALKAHRNPFDAETLQKLRSQ